MSVALGEGKKPGIVIEIPPSRRLHIRYLLTDYTGTLAYRGTLDPAVVERLTRVSQLVDVVVLTSDSFGTAVRELAAVGIAPRVLQDGDGSAVEQKQRIAESFELSAVAAFGNGRNDQLLLQCVRAGGGLAVAVDNGEGCAVETLLQAEIFVWGAQQALDLLLEPMMVKASLRS